MGMIAQMGDRILTQQRVQTRTGEESCLSNRSANRKRKFALTR